MRWFEWVYIAFIASLAASVMGHISVSEWAFHLIKKLDQNPSSGTKLLSSNPKMMAYRYAASFVNGTITQKLLKIALAVLWIPLLLVFALLAGVFFGLDQTHLKITFYLDRRKYSRMTPEQKRDHTIESEKKLLALASKVRLSPHAMESNHPLDSAYREMMLTGESIALKKREAREQRERSEGGR
jgi:hypothetical protein